MSLLVNLLSAKAFILFTTNSRQTLCIGEGIDDMNDHSIIQQILHLHRVS